ncbi:hypothetical protein KDA82_16735 [Streptomyces daliensis]|uniref:Uncharacterized protein n=1 Tax=Streptomyces daliensis TaxID=299421 RepID=A0A8T4IQQ8_9ACTN|nr:hypothetical protein [Streptomyces daliensis]
MSDVNRLNKHFPEIIASDHRHGGQLSAASRRSAEGAEVPSFLALDRAAS